MLSASLSGTVDDRPNPGATPVVHIVDDDEAVREGLKLLVEAFGWTARGYGSADEFLDGGAAEQPGCLLLDLHMPGMSGADLQERLAERGRALPTIVITAYPEDPLVQRAVQAGARAVMSKPFSDDELLDNIQKALDEPS